MKNKLLLLLSIILFSVMPKAEAGFLMKKTTVTAVSATTAASQAQKAAVYEQHQGVFSNARQLMHAPLDRWAYRGWLGTLSIICGVLGFFYPFLGFAALLFGFMGMGRRRNRHPGVAVVGLVLGLIIVGMVIFGGFSGFPLF